MDEQRPVGAGTGNAAASSAEAPQREHGYGRRDGDARDPVLPQQVAAQLETLIARGVFRPSGRLKETDLSSRFSVSRGTVRDALRLLSARGLVELQPRQGARVVGLGPSEIVDVFNIQAVMYGLAARLVASAGTGAGLEELDRRVRRLEAMAADPDANSIGFIKELIAIQGVVMDGAGNRRLAMMYDQLNTQAIWRIMWLQTPPDFLTRKRRLQVAGQNRRLYDLVRDGEADKAEALVRKMVHTSRDAAIQHMLRMV